MEPVTSVDIGCFLSQQLLPAICQVTGKFICHKFVTRRTEHARVF